MKRILVAIVSAMFLLPLAAPTSASAHYGPYGEGYAETKIYNDYNWHCGNGDTWVCIDRNVYLDAYAYGEHSWRVIYYFAEKQMPFGNVRECRIEARVNAHTGLTDQFYGEWC